MALKKKRPAKWTWNKGLEVGQKDAFKPAQVKRIRQVLSDHGIPGLRNLALFSVAIDTMLQGPELLNLTVKDVALGNGTVRPVIEVARTRRKSPVRCTLSKATAKALGKWIAVSGKKRADYIFPGRGALRIAQTGPEYRSDVRQESRPGTSFGPSMIQDLIELGGFFLH